MSVFPHGTDNSIWISTYSEACLSRKHPGTIDVYQRVLRDFLLWLAELPGYASFHLNQLTRTTVETYMAWTEGVIQRVFMSLPLSAINDSRKLAFITGSTLSNNGQPKTSGRKSLTFHSTIYAMILHIEHGKLAGR